MIDEVALFILVAVLSPVTLLYSITSIADSIVATAGGFELEHVCHRVGVSVGRRWRREDERRCHVQTRPQRHVQVDIGTYGRATVSDTFELAEVDQRNLTTVSHHDPCKLHTELSVSVEVWSGQVTSVPLSVWGSDLMSSLSGSRIYRV